MDTPTSIDLSTLDTRKAADAGYELTLIHPKTGDALPAAITIRGTDSAVYQERLREIQRQRALQLQRNRKAQVTPDEIEDNALELLAALTIAWRGMTLDAKPIDCTPANARMVYQRFPWIREQVDAAAGDRANFLTSAASA